MDYKKLYYDLFAKIADATEAIEKMNFGQAHALLVAAQQEAESTFLETGETGI